ncbi:MAG: hypothetical protein ACK5ES_10380, partial [Planctomyces sp.]
MQRLKRAGAYGGTGGIMLSSVCGMARCGAAASSNGFSAGRRGAESMSFFGTRRGRQARVFRPTP